MTEMKKTAIITGGGKGIGATLSQEFAASGYNVVIASREDNGLAAKLGPCARFVSTDVRKPASLFAMAEEARAWTGKIDVLVNNVGISAWKSLLEIDEAFWHDMVETNLKSVLFATQAVVPHMPKGGAIINMSSLAGKRGSANNSVYCATKFGVNGITQSLAKELGGRGLRVNAVCPVYIRTEGLEAALAEQVSPTGGADISSYLASFSASQSALGRMPTADEVAAMCVFLASDAASAITGQCVNIDCGVMPQ